MRVLRHITRNLVFLVVLVLTLATSTQADISFNGGGGSGGGGGSTPTTGTWTPTLIGDTGAGSATYSVQIGNYMEIVGRTQTWVLATFYIQTSAFSGASGNLEIGGLPVASVNTVNQYFLGAVSQYQGLTFSSGTQLGVQVAPGATTLGFITGGSGVSSSTIPVGNAGASVQVLGQIFYRAT